MKTFLILLLFLLASNAQAATRYVDANLSSNCSGNYSIASRNCTGSNGDAYTTANRGAAITATVAGDILYYRSGTYAGINNNIQTINSGTSYANAVTIAEYPGDTVTWTLAASTNAAINLTSSTLKYVIFDGMTLDGTGGDYSVGTFSTVSYIKFNNVEFKNSTNYACVQLGSGSHHFWITGGSIHHCGSYGVYPESGDHLVENLTIYTTGQNGSGNNYAIHNFTNNTPLTEPSRNIYRKLVVYDTGGILLWRGDQNIATRNIVYNSDRCFSVRGGATNTVVYNNTCYNPTTYAFELEGSINTILRNNIHWAGASTSIVTGTGTVQSHNACYVSGCTGTGAQNGVNPSFVNEAGNNFNLTSTSAMINAGVISIGSCPAPLNCTYTVPYNGTAPDIGAFETWGLTSCNVGNVAANKLRCNVENNVNTPVLAPSVTGWTALESGGNKALSSIAVIGTSIIELTTSANYGSGTSCDVQYATTGTASDSALIGNTLNQRLNAVTSVSCTNTVAGGGTSPVFTQTHARVRNLYGTEVAVAVDWKTAEDTAYTIIPGGAARIRTKAKVTTADPVAFNPTLQYDFNDNVWNTWTDTCSASALVCAFGTSLNIEVSNGAATTEQLTSDLATNIACSVILTSGAVPSLDPSQDSEWECEYAIKTHPTISVGTVIRFRQIKDGATPYDTYSVYPTLTVANPGLTQF